MVTETDDKGGDIMPAGDRTGPMGMGPMTGRGTGYCGGSGAPGYGYAGPGFGLGLGWRGGRGGFGGRGRGFARGGFGFRGWGGNAPGPHVPAQEEQDLRERADMLQAELDAVRRRLDDLAARDGDG